MRTLNQIDLSGKKVLLRADFDVPIGNHSQTRPVESPQVLPVEILESFRIRKQKPTVDFLLNNGATAVAIAHIKAINSFKAMISELENILGREIELIDNLGELGSRLSNLKPGKLYLLDNVRNWSGEEKNDELFAKTLSTGFDLYINNAFAVCHRKHASVSAVAKFLPSYPGFLIEEETAQLDKLITMPKDGKIFVMGGAKASTKVPVIKNFIGKTRNILLGGVIANDILKARGVDIGLSIADENVAKLLEGLDIGHKSLIMPVDFNIFEKKIYDIGPNTIRDYVNTIGAAEIIIWNGPVGLYEDPRFDAGTNSIAKAIANSRAFKTIGGGDTIAAVDKLGLLDKFDFVSTGGGAMLEFLAGNRLPGLEALGYYK